MSRLIMISVLLTINLSLWSQDNHTDFNKYLIGDWYFFDYDNDSICSYDSSYNEIVFSDSFLVIINQCDFNSYSALYKVEDNKILAYSVFDSAILWQGTIVEIDSFRLSIAFKDYQLRFHRIIDKKYKLSEHIEDNRAVGGLDLHLPYKLMRELLFVGEYYYNSCAKRRELWIRLERNEIDKKSVIDWADKLIKHSDYDIEIREVKVFKAMVDNIFD